MILTYCFIESEVNNGWVSYDGSLFSRIVPMECNQIITPFLKEEKKTEIAESFKRKFKEINRKKRRGRSTDN